MAQRQPQASPALERSSTLSSLFHRTVSKANNAVGQAVSGGGSTRGTSIDLGLAHSPPPPLSMSQMKSQFAHDPNGARFPSMVDRMNAVVSLRPQLLGTDQFPVYVPPDLSQLPCIKSDPSKMYTDGGAIITDELLPICQVDPPAQKSEDCGPSTVDFVKETAVRLGIVASSSMTGKKVDVEVTFLTLDGYRSLAVRINNPRAILERHPAGLRVAGYLRVKNWSGKPMEISSATIELCGVWSGAKSSKKLTNFRILNAFTTILLVNDVKYLPFEFRFEHAVAPSVDFKTGTWPGMSCIYHITAAVTNLSNGLSGKKVTTTHSHDVEIPYHPRSLLKYHMYGNIIPITYHGWDTGGNRTTATIDNSVYYPGSRFKIAVSVSNKHWPSFRLNAELYEIYGQFGRSHVGSRIYHVAIPLEVTQISNSLIMEGKLECYISIPKLRDERNPAARKPGAVNYDGVWGNLAVTHVLRVSAISQVGGVNQSQSVEFPVIIAPCSIEQCLDAGVTHPEMVIRMINLPSSHTVVNEPYSAGPIPHSEGSSLLDELAVRPQQYTAHDLLDEKQSLLFGDRPSEDVDAPPYFQEATSAAQPNSGEIANASEREDSLRSASNTTSNRASEDSSGLPRLNSQPAADEGSTSEIPQGATFEMDSLCPSITSSSAEELPENPSASQSPNIARIGSTSEHASDALDRRHLLSPLQISTAVDDPKKWSCERVEEWLRELGIDSDIIARFKTEEINGIALLALDGQMLKDDLGVQKLGVRLTILESVRDLRMDSRSAISARQSHGGAVTPEPSSELEITAPPSYVSSSS